MERPLGITIIAVLYIIGGIGGMIAAAMFGVFSAMIANPMMEDTMIGKMVVFGGLVTAVFVSVAILGFVIAGCLLLGKRWARQVVIAFVIIDLVLEFFSIFGGNVFGTAIVMLDLFVLYYLYRPHVMEYFGTLSYKNCSYCGYIAKDDRELHNHLITCEGKKQSE